MKLFLIFITILGLLAEQWTVTAVPSDALVIRDVRSIAARDASVIFSDLTSNDTGVSIMLEPNVPWEDFIVPGPTIIALLGQLMVISGKIDFSLLENAPQGGFKYMRHPESFRASLVQVSNDGWTAFMNAHKNMDKIQLYMQQVPAQVKTTIKILSQASPKVIEKLLPIALTRIQEIGRTCVQLSAETEDKFSDVMLLLGELLAVTESSRGTHEQKLTQVQAELNVTATQKQYLQTIGEELKKRQQQVDTEVSKYRSAYDKALSKIPTGWKAMVQDLFRSAINLVNYLPSMFGMGGLGGKSVSGNMGTQDSGPSPDFEKSKVFAVVGNFFNQVGQIKDAVKNLFSGKGTDPSKGNPSSMFSSLQVVLDSFQNMLKDVNPSDTSNKAMQFIGEGKNLFKDLESMFSQFPSRQLNESEKAECTQKLENLENDMKPMIAEGMKMTGGLATGQGASQSAGGLDPGTFSGNYGNERFKAYLSLQALRDAENRYDQIFGEVMKYHEEMKQLVTKMASLDMQKINFEEILELLKEGIKILAKIREQWGKLVQFFTLVSVRADVALNQTLIPFVEYAKQAQQTVGELSPDDRQFFISILQDQAVDINKVAYFLYTLSSTYFDVSTRFLMNRLAGLAQMLATDNETQRQQLLIQLRDQANEAQEAIKQMSQQRRQEYTRLVNMRKQELDDMVKKLGGPTESDKMAVQSVYGQL